MRSLLTFLTGALFGAGIAISGMANPAKVIIFVAALVAGMFAARFILDWAKPRAQPTE